LARVDARRARDRPPWCAWCDGRRDRAALVDELELELEPAVGVYTLQKFHSERRASIAIVNRLNRHERAIAIASSII